MDTPTATSTTSSDSEHGRGFFARFRGRWTASGDPVVVAVVVAGAVLLATQTAGRLVARRRRSILRQPTMAEAHGIADPLARIMCRHLPMEALSPDLADAIEAVAAADAYASKAPLFQPLSTQETTQ